MGHKLSHWHFKDTMAALCCVLLLAWFFLPTSRFITDTNVTFDGHDMTLSRRLPFGNKSAYWTAEISMIHSPLECDKGEWTDAYYQVKRSNAVTKTLGDWATPCLELREPFTYNVRRQVYLFGFLPLIPSASTYQITPKG